MTTWADPIALGDPRTGDESTILSATVTRRVERTPALLVETFRDGGRRAHFRPDTVRLDYQLLDGVGYSEPRWSWTRAAAVGPYVYSVTRDDPERPVETIETGLQMSREWGTSDITPPWLSRLIDRSTPPLPGAPDDDPADDDVDALGDRVEVDDQVSRFLALTAEQLGEVCTALLAAESQARHYGAPERAAQMGAVHRLLGERRRTLARTERVERAIARRERETAGTAAGEVSSDG